MAWSEKNDESVREFCKTVDVGKLTECPKCSMGKLGASEMMLTMFCTHAYCPFRAWTAEQRQKDVPRRIDALRHTPAEKAIVEALREVEKLPGDPALTDAVVLLMKAKNRVADYVDGIK